MLVYKLWWWCGTFTELLNSGNRTEWSQIWSIMYEWVTNLDDCKVGVWFVKNKCDYR